MRWILLLIAAVILLPLVWKLLSFATSLAFGVVYFVTMLALVIFLVGLVRRLLVPR